MTEPEVDEAAAGAAHERAPVLSEELRADLLLRLKKINGQVTGVARMVEQDRYCADVLQQINAAQSALDAVSRKVARNYLERCVTDAVNHGDPLIYDEVMRVVFRNR